MNKENLLKAIIIMGFVALIFYLTPSRTKLTNDLRSEKSFNFIYSIILESNNNENPIKVWIPIPPTNEVQKISSITLDDGGFVCNEHTEEIHRNKYYYCESLSGLKENTEINLSFDVKRQEHRKVNYNNLDKELYKISSSSVPVGDVFNEVIQENNLDKNSIRNIYDFILVGMHYGKPKNKSLDDEYYSGKNPNTNIDWLPDTITYGRKNVTKDEIVDLFNIADKNPENIYTFGNGNSRYACDIGVGNCTDFHSYFISLCRTLGVPSRFHMGFLLPNNEGEINGYHCWADYYIDGKGWYPVDISEADKNPSKNDYFFGTLDNNRVEFTIGRDLKLFGGRIENFFIYPLVEGTKSSKKFSYKNLN